MRLLVPEMVPLPAGRPLDSPSHARRRALVVEPTELPMPLRPIYPSEPPPDSRRSPPLRPPRPVWLGGATLRIYRLTPRPPPTPPDLPSALPQNRPRRRPLRPPSADLLYFLVPLSASNRLSEPMKSIGGSHALACAPNPPPPPVRVRTFLNDLLSNGLRLNPSGTSSRATPCRGTAKADRYKNVAK